MQPRQSETPGQEEASDVGANAPDEEWSRAETARIGKCLANRRAELGRLSARALAERTAQLGFPVSRSTLAKLERGGRDDLTVSELRVLAAALEMPPALLLYPVGTSEQVAPLPSMHTDSWTAYKTLLGELVLVPGGQVPEDAVLRGPNVGLRRPEPVVDAYQRHDHSAVQWRMHREHDPDRAEGWLAALSSVRREMASHGWIPPMLAPDTALALAAVGGDGRNDEGDDEDPS